VVRHIFQACPEWIYTQSNITSIIIDLIIYIFVLVYAMNGRFMSLVY
jgi:hypothetical protein